MTDAGTSAEHDVVGDVRKVAGDLQAALDHFRADSRLLDLAERQVPDARSRLAHVLTMTDEAAHRTMDLVDHSCPLVDAVARAAETLIPRTVVPEQQAFLEFTLTNMKAVRGKLTEVLLTQGYQDLSGQIIRSVMILVDELEVALGTLVRIVGPDTAPGQATSVPASSGFGPVVPGVNHGCTVDGQKDVDAMLSGLGM